MKDRVQNKCQCWWRENRVISYNVLCQQKQKDIIRETTSDHKPNTTAEIMSCRSDREWKLNTIYYYFCFLYSTRWCDTELWYHGGAGVSQTEASPRVGGSVSERSAAGLGCLFTDTDLHRVLGASVLQQQCPGSCGLPAPPDGTVCSRSAHGEANYVEVTQYSCPT